MKKYTVLWGLAVYLLIIVVIAIIAECTKWMGWQ
jgi:hypothetical protein